MSVLPPQNKYINDKQQKSRSFIYLLCDCRLMLCDKKYQKRDTDINLAQIYTLHRYIPCNVSESVVVVTAIFWQTVLLVYHEKKNGVRDCKTKVCWMQRHPNFARDFLTQDGRINQSDVTLCFISLITNQVGFFLPCLSWLRLLALDSR